nr:immunoglobulin heavy chain junction region [Macaca mulatta]
CARDEYGSGFYFW